MVISLNLAIDALVIIISVGFISTVLAVKYLFFRG
jgi:hypothetical protein